ncbi:hypothetical protein ACWKTZ_25190 [Bacillus cereus]
MLNQNAIETVKNNYSNTYGVQFIQIEQVNETTLKNMLTACDSKKHMEEIINWYTDEEDNTYNNWVDVEGEGYGWLWVDKPEDKWHEILRDSLLKYIENKKQHIIENIEYVIIVSTEIKTIYHFVERESSMRDVIYTFSNEELSY